MRKIFGFVCQKRRDSRVRFGSKNKNKIFIICVLVWAMWRVIKFKWIKSLPSEPKKGSGSLEEQGSVLTVKKVVVLKLGSKARVVMKRKKSKFVGLTIEKSRRN